MNSECVRIADQLRRAFSGDPWHGDPLSVLLTGITAEQACARPLAHAHNMWELLLHIDAYVQIAFGATGGVPMPKLYGTEGDWPKVQDNSPAAWAAANEQLFRHAEVFAYAIAEFADSRLNETVPGRDYDFYYLFHGIVQHSLYHGGQIALLKRVVS